MKFTKYIKPDDGQIMDISAIDAGASELLDLIEKVDSNERYRALAKTSLEQTVMWINKGIYARKEK